MEKEFIKKNKYVFRRFFLFFLILVVFTFIFRAINGRMYKEYKTQFATLKTYEKTVPAIGVNILDEMVYTAKEDGISVYNTSEGQKVAVGYQIASLNMMDDTSNLNDELIKVNSALNYKSKDHVVYSAREALPAVETIQAALKDRKLTDAINDIDRLDLYSNNNANISELSELINLSVEELSKKKEELQNKISKSNLTYTADFASVVSFNIDGLEKYYTLSDIDDYTYEYLNAHKNISDFQTKVEVSAGEALYKLINNLRYRIALQVSSTKELGNPAIGDILNFKNDELSLMGKVVHINSTKSGAVVIVELTQNFFDVYKQRIRDFDIVLKKEECLEIPKTAILKKDNQFGVYVQEIHGLVKFVPIKVVVPFEETSYIATGDKNSRLKIGDNTVKTVTLNDKIVLNPKQVDESKILN